MITVTEQNHDCTIYCRMIGESIFELDYVDSTNAYANRLLQLGPVEDGRVIWAHEQYAGRGQHDHTWLSEPGKNLTISIILQPSFLLPERQFLLNKAVSLAVIDFVNAVLEASPPSEHPADVRPPVTIKWPNDIYIGYRKAGGILIENKIMGNAIAASVAGIGLNINQNTFSCDLPNPVSLVQTVHHEIDIRKALQSLCSHLDRRYRMIQPVDKQEDLNPEYDARLLGYGQVRPFTSDMGPLEGTILGVNSLGQLRLETRQGEVFDFSHGEVEYVF